MKKFNKIILIILSITFYTNAFAQNKDEKKHAHKNKMSIGILASPDIYIFNFKTNGLSKPTYNIQTNYSLGGTIIYHPMKLITLRAAFLYTTKGYSVDYSADVNNPTAQNLMPKTQNFDLKYLDIPLMVNLNLIHKDHIQVFLSAGIIPSILLKKEGESIQQDGSTKATNLDNINNFFAGTTYSFGVKYNLTEWLGVGFEPYFRYYLDKVDSASMDLAPMSFGGKFSTVINFNHY